MRGTTKQYRAVAREMKTSAVMTSAHQSHVRCGASHQRSGGNALLKPSREIFSAQIFCSSARNLVAEMFRMVARKRAISKAIIRISGNGSMRHRRRIFYGMRC